ncbi:GNAT family N-acetyltransferase [Granulosicoccus sp. 3-233]|uniref:GNAT family N-acetyltransferase n=1 Tax=Granulosicoccus sp. 3-233 TaxID=3417969 RepID=UPI003D334189
MSRLDISNDPGLMQYISELRERARIDRHRALLIIENPPAGHLQDLATLLDVPFLTPNDNADRADRITALLGREFGILIHETLEAVDAGLLAALAGTLKAGGLLILGVPFALRESESNTATQPIGRFQQRLTRLLLQSAHRHGNMIRIGCGADMRPLKADARGDDATTYRQGIANCTTTAHSADNDLPDSAAVSEQDELLDAAVAHLRQHPRGCITITGRRGRGKSVLLGRIAQELLQQGISVAMTAARRSALQSLENQGVRIPFIAAADAVHAACQVLLVDEAASLSVDTLTRYLQQHPQIIYATTIDGYEQAGRAFDIRFNEVLQRQRHHVLHLHPHTPWRWNRQDPLEEFLDTLLLTGQSDTQSTNADTHKAPGSALTGQLSGEDQHWPDSHSADRQVRRLDRDELARDETLLAEVFSLLRDSHYQTTASDIAHLLDGPELQIWVLEEQRRLEAALLLVVEGELDTELHDAVLSKQRRLPHQLLPQLLAQSANQTAPLQARMARVIRIAVPPARRRRGLGSLLLQQVTRSITVPQGGSSALGASFAGDSSRLDFWTANGFTRFHTGFRRNPRTGTQAIAVLKAFDSPVNAALQEAARIHDDNQCWLHDTNPHTAHDPVDMSLLTRFSRSQRSLVDTYAALSRLAMQYPLTLSPPPGISRRQHEATLREAVARCLETESARFSQ